MLKNIEGNFGMMKTKRVPNWSESMLQNLKGIIVKPSPVQRWLFDSSTRSAGDIEIAWAGTEAITSNDTILPEPPMAKVNHCMLYRHFRCYVALFLQNFEDWESRITSFAYFLPPLIFRYLVEVSYLYNLWYNYFAHIKLFCYSRNYFIEDFADGLSAACWPKSVSQPVFAGVLIVTAGGLQEILR